MVENEHLASGKFLREILGQIPSRGSRSSKRMCVRMFRFFFHGLPGNYPVTREALPLPYLYLTLTPNALLLQLPFTVLPGNPKGIPYLAEA